MKSYQETRRESWLLEETEIEVDTWPWIPPFIEIEGKNEIIVRSVAEGLGFDWRNAKHGSVENIYEEGIGFFGFNCVSHNISLRHCTYSY